MKLELRGVSKRFGDVVANDDVSLSIGEGEIVCLLGENGAGKSTLMNLLFGVTTPDAGSLAIDGQLVQFTGPQDAIAAGIGMVQQHFTLVPTLSVADNVALGCEPAGWCGWLDRRRTREDVEQLSDEYGLTVSPDALVEDLSVGVQQRVEIIKALHRQARLLILDEPTAVLTPQESERLFGIMRKLRADGRSVIFISHKLPEVRAVADRIVVIRRGRVVGESNPAASEAELAALMVGRPVEQQGSPPPAVPGRAVLRLDGAALRDETERTLLSNINLEVRAGEVLALAGVEGNGQREIIDLLLGRRPPSAGRIDLCGLDVAGRPTREILAAGVGFVPEDRNRDGLVGGFSVAENLVLDTYRSARFSAHAHLRRHAIAQNAEVLMREFDIRARTSSTAAGTLSGGNAQKVVVARALSRRLKLLIAVEPARGLDIGSVEFVRRRLVEAREAGTAIVLVSADLDEVVALADRIAVLYRGGIVDVVSPDVSREQLGLMMAGAGPVETVR